jgi:hypothetical protein
MLAIISEGTSSIKCVLSTNGHGHLLQVMLKWCVYVSLS